MINKVEKMESVNKHWINRLQSSLSMSKRERSEFPVLLLLLRSDYYHVATISERNSVFSTL